MKSLKLEVIRLSIFLGFVLIFNQTVFSQENQCSQSNPISLNYVLSKFRFTSRKVKTVEQINEELIAEILKKKVFFELNTATEKSLTDAGANYLLIETIKENFPADLKKKIDLYNRYSANYQSINIERIEEAIKVAEEYVRLFENDECEKVQIQYFKEAVSILKTYIIADKPDGPNPKITLKYKILKEITEKYKIKNWDEVFALGKKVYEIDPEFVPLFNDLASLGFDQAKLYGRKSKYNAETVFYAELAVKLLETSEKDFAVYSGLGYSYKTKAEALDRMKEILDYMKSQNLYKTNFESVK